jgi:hypothetical protein
MRKLIAASLAAGLIATSAASATQNSRADVIAACQKEAATGYALAWKMEPSLRSTIDSHRKKMSNACAAFASGTISTTAALSQCLHETSAGPVHIQSGRDRDREHIARQRDLCRELGAEKR